MLSEAETDRQIEDNVDIRTASPRNHGRAKLHQFASVPGGKHRRVAKNGDQIALTPRAFHPQYAEPVLLPL
jgi:hypothetical protein